jgi:hypothetical protein
MKYTEKDLEYFCNTIWDSGFSNNNGGMGAPDLFSLFFLLQTINPKVIIESGVWNGISTKLIRKVCPDAILYCLDPREIPMNGYRDKNKNTIYYTGSKFKDFKELDLSIYNTNEVLCFFDCHQNAYLRLQECLKKGITHVLFNDNYPVGCGSHYTIEHLLYGDMRHYTISTEEKNKIKDSIKLYTIFPNIYPGNIQTGEGVFKCTSFFESDNDKYPIFKEERHRYRWNTYIKLK